MKYKLLGKSGLRVSEVCLGTMTFGEEWGWGTDFETSKKIYDAYVDVGGNFIDTANMYTEGTSEKFVGEFVKNDRDNIVVATKYSLRTKSFPKVNQAGNHRKNLVQSVDASLKRLNMDYVDLLWVHIWDFTTPVSEVMRSLDDLVRSGKVLYLGVSDAPAWIVSQANTYAELMGLTPFVALQIEYSLKERTPERDLLPMADAFGMTITPWSPLGGGLLTGKYNAGSSKEQGRYQKENSLSKFTENDLKIAETVIRIAKETGHTPAQVALRWMTQQHHNLIPIIGATKVPQLQDSLGYLLFELSAEHMKQLNEVSAINMGFPTEFFNGNTCQDFAFGGTLKQLEELAHHG